MPDSGGERLIATYSDKPYTGVNKRYITVNHRFIANWIPGVGADIRHEIKCEERGIESWSLAESWEMRDHGIEKVTTDLGKGLP